ncbi:MAG: response regulator transcription factor [Ignavibacteriales bacterium]|nr:response regulator transcription factor [Ignavibacteriales bacterium]
MRSSVRNTILLYGSAMAALFTGLKLVEYRFLVKDLSLEILLGVVALVFAAVGVWAGRRLSRQRIITGDPDFRPNQQELDRLHISRRELEVLEMMARGLSNKEIADTLYISLSTVKTHTSNLFQKLEAGRRTQALRRARELGLIP